MSSLTGSAQLIDSDTQGAVPIPTTITVVPYPENRNWFVLELTQGSLAQGKKYKVVMSLRKLGASSGSPGNVTADISIDNTAIVSPILRANTNTYEFASHLGYLDGVQCSLEVKDFYGQVKPVKTEDCRNKAPVEKGINASNIGRLLPIAENIGSFFLTLSNGDRDSQLVPSRVPGLVDIFGTPVKVDSKAQLATEKAPSTKDASSYYFNFNWAAGKAAKPGWVLDGKVSPAIGDPIGGYQFTPLAAADVGQNQVPNVTFTDTIRFGANFSHMYQPNDILQGLLFTPGVAYETDKEFDRDNLLATPDLRFNFVGLYKPRQRRTLAKFWKEKAIAETRQIEWTPADTKPVLFGWLLDFHTGSEIGGALVDTTVKASSGKAKLALPSYQIARVVPQVHGILEIRSFSIEATGTARWLTAVENTVLERQDHTLFLKRLHDWFGYGVFTGAWNFDPAGHFALTTTYKNGFSPPKFARVNTVQAGISIKY